MIRFVVREAYGLGALPAARRAAVAKEGGHARAVGLTRERRREIAQAAARARWDRR